MSIQRCVLSIVFVLLISTSFQSQPTTKQASNKKCELFIFERLRHYFDLNEFEPVQTFNNTDGPLWEKGVKKFQLGAHTVEWTYEPEGRQYHSSIKINGDLVRLDDLKTINVPESETRFGFDMVNQWDEIKLYEIGGQNIIAISMRTSPCTGLSCSVGVQLWYDVKSKSPTLFGTYRTDSKLRLLNWPGGGDLYVLGSNYVGDPRGEVGPNVRRYEFYKLLPDGQFASQSNKLGKRYFLNHTSYPDMEQVKGKWRRKANLPVDTLEQNWLEDVLAF